MPKLRNFDNWNINYTKSGEKLTSGSILFRDGAGVSVKDIYNRLGNTIQNPQPLNSAGRTNQQVFLEADQDYTVIVRNSSGAEVNRYLSKKLEVGIDVGDALIKVDDVITLKATRGSTGMMVILLGYDTPGDKPYTFYKWSSTGPTGGEDMGSAIECTEGGWWIIVDMYDYVDVRDFGVFGTSTPTNVEKVQITRANLYATARGVPLRFTAVNGLYFDIEGCTIISATSDNNAVLWAPTAATASAEIQSGEDIYVLGTATSKVKLGGKQLKLSQSFVPAEGSRSLDAVKFNASERLIIDEVFDPGDQEGITIELDEDSILFSDSIKFTDCVFTGKGNFDCSSQIEFDSCSITGSMFDDESDLATITFTNCSSALAYWENPTNYLNFQLKCGVYSIDMQGATVDMLPSIDSVHLISNAVIKDATHTYESTTTTGDFTNWDCTNCWFDCSENLYGFRSSNARCTNCIFECQAGIGISLSLYPVEGDENNQVVAYFNNCTFKNQVTAGQETNSVTPTVMADGATTAQAALWDIWIFGCDYVGSTRDAIKVGSPATLSSVISIKLFHLQGNSNTHWDNNVHKLVLEGIPVYKDNDVPASPPEKYISVDDNSSSGTYGLGTFVGDGWDDLWKEELTGFSFGSTILSVSAEAVNIGNASETSTTYVRKNFEWTAIRTNINECRPVGDPTVHPGTLGASDNAPGNMDTEEFYQAVVVFTFTAV